MHPTLRLSLPVLLFVCLAARALAQEQVVTMRQAEALLTGGELEQAARAFEAITAAEPDNHQAWFQLGSARHGLKDWSAAIEANRRAARSPSHRPSALYNVACAQSLDGRIEEARASLALAQAAGFLDFDLLATDADLEPLRAQQALVLAPQRSYRELKARNGIALRYALLEPRGFESGKRYPVLVAFAPGGGTRSADWMIETLWPDVDQQEQWIVVCLVAPEPRGWLTHPAHHALEELLRALQQQYPPTGGRFHLFGFASSCRAALNYSIMSKSFFQSMTLVSSSAWGSYDDADMAHWKSMPVLQIVGATSYTLESDRDMHERLLRKGVQATLDVIPGDGLLVESLRGRALLSALR